MRQSADTMQRNGIVHATAKDLLSYSDGATVEQIAAVTGYTSKDVEKAIKSLSSQGVLSIKENAIVEVKPFRAC